MKKLTFSLITILLLWPVFSANAQNYLDGPEDIVFDIQRSRLLVSNWVSGAIVQIDSNGTQSYFKTGISHSHGMELVGDTVYVASDARIYGIRLSDAQTILDITIPAAERLGHITIDDSLNLYATDWSANKIFRINLNDQSYSTIVETGVNTPVGIMVNGEYNRLILCQFAPNIPILAIDMGNYSLSTVGTGHFNYLDAIVRDNEGNFYISIWSTGEVLKYNSEFSNSPELISAEHDGPSGLGYNSAQHILGVTNYNANSISLVPLASSNIHDLGNTWFSNFLLLQNYPNPFNSTTLINYNIPKQSHVVLKVYNNLGQEIKTLVNEKQIVGNKSVIWDGTDNSGKTVPSGFYIYRIYTGDRKQSKRMLLVK